jgi:hypothetical protein
VLTKKMHVELYKYSLAADSLINRRSINKSSYVHAHSCRTDRAEEPFALGYKHSACTVSIIDMNKLSIARSPCVYMAAAAVYLHTYIHKYEYILIRTHHCIREAI